MGGETSGCGDKITALRKGDGGRRRRGGGVRLRVVKRGEREKGLVEHVIEGKERVEVKLIRTQKGWWMAGREWWR